MWVFTTSVDLCKLDELRKKASRVIEVFFLLHKQLVMVKI